MRLGTLLLLATMVIACRGGACTKDQAPPTEMTDGTRVPVEIDGKPGTTIDRALLDRVAPDFVEDGRKGWRLRSLLAPGAFDDRATIEVEDAQGQRVILAQPSGSVAGREPIVAVNRAGELRMALARTDDEDVFASFHGRGGNRGRGGEPGRVREVRHVWIETHPAR